MWQGWRMFSSIGMTWIIFWTSSARVAVTMEVNLVRSSIRREAPRGLQWADSVQLQCLGSFVMLQQRTYTPPAAAAMTEHRAMCVGAAISSSYFCLLWGCSELHCSLRLFLPTPPSSHSPFKVMDLHHGLRATLLILASLLHYHS